jgi:hypothetical protein
MCITIYFPFNSYEEYPMMKDLKLTAVVVKVLYSGIWHSVVRSKSTFNGIQAVLYQKTQFFRSGDDISYCDVRLKAEILYC